jgi:YHS domain-containing protein
MRVILEAVIAVLVITILRAVIGIIVKGASDLFNSSPQASGPGTPPRSKPIPTADALKKDPVCGTFIAASTSVQKTIAGETYYFCSTQCRDKFAGAVRKAG